MEGDTDRLELAWWTDGDGTGRLGCAVSVEGWGGRSEAWFNRTTVLEFADGLRAFPLTADGGPALAGGYSQGPNWKTEVTTLNLRAVPVGGRGQVGLEVQLRQWETDCPLNDPQSVIHVRLLCTYPGLERFADEVEAMVGPEFPDPLVGHFAGNATIEAEYLA